jgi:hypothetical protein
LKVEFLLDGALVGSSTTAPYTMTYDSLMQDDGNHTLVAKATDTTGQYSKATMSFIIANGQLVRNGSFEKGYGVGWSNTSGMQIGTILGQTAYDGTKMAKFCGTGSKMSVALYQSVAIPANASLATLSFALHVETKETNSAVTHDTFAVQIRNSSGVILKTLATYSNQNAAAGYKVYNFDLAEYKGQTIQLYFLGAEDAALSTGFILDKVNLMVSGGDGDHAPTISASESGSSGMITLSATASDDVGVTKVEFYVDNSLKGTDETAPYSITLDSKTLTNNTPHSLVAKAYDAAGNIGVSTPVSFSVHNPDTDPSPVISVSESGTSGIVTLIAIATDNTVVTKVEFYVDNILKGTDTTSPYSMTLDSLTLSEGEHVLVGKAYDDAGNIGTSPGVSFSITQPGKTTYNEVENNGTASNANVISDSVTKIVGYIGTSTDKDYFRINVPGGRTVTVSMTGPAKDYDLYLLSSSGTTLRTSANPAATESVTYKNTGTVTATYFIKVVAFGAAYTTTMPYNLALSR